MLKIENGKIRPIINILKRFSEIKTISSSDASCELILFVKFDNLKDLQTFISKNLKKFKDTKEIELGIFLEKIVK